MIWSKIVILYDNVYGTIQNYQLSTLVLLLLALNDLKGQIEALTDGATNKALGCLVNSPFY
jgi:hypothetical protein